MHDKLNLKTPYFLSAPNLSAQMMNPNVQSNVNKIRPQISVPGLAQSEKL